MRWSAGSLLREHQSFESLCNRVFQPEPLLSALWIAVCNYRNRFLPVARQSFDISVTGLPLFRSVLSLRFRIFRAGEPFLQKTDLFQDRCAFR